ncbi:hypothetical protein EV138_1746 [Kribbella voronezhensis]|uniref:Uncharacterized protein n=1 Tax=Kribbella voronezhensis TaxID=2512212 RepID=A0A4R7T8G2_9ACTN|nr:hypothetical protein [Kribbella voronezhensis]TDU88204.1 hypothetical protein EV138_1746 [Kribbella voronezhensis]
MSTSSSSRHEPPRGRRHLAVVVAAVVTILIVIGGTALLVLRNHDSAPAGPGTTASPTSTAPSVSPSTTPPTVTPSTPTPDTTTPSTTPSTPSERASALRALTPFLTAAAKLDRQLQEAAAAINGAGPPWTTITPAVAAKVRAADLKPVARRIPAGLPPSLQQAVVLVYSDLSSRRHAISSFEIVGPFQPPLSAGETPTQVGLQQIRNGHAAAVRFDGDLAAARSLAAATPSIGKYPASSRKHAEVLLLVRYAELANGGCDTHGGAVLTRLPVIKWLEVPSVGTYWTTNGTINGLEFTAKFTGSWHIELLAC